MHALPDKRVVPLVTTRDDRMSVHAGTVCEKQGITVRGRTDERELAVG